MILTSIGPDAPFHRAFTPRWAHAPESGAGAALVGGRFNRPGVEARYLAATAQTALAEYQGESPLLLPATLVTFMVTARNIVDFTAGYDPAHWTPIWAEAHGNWKGLAFLEGIEPPTWVIGDIVRDAGHPGILYRSLRHPDGVCLVLFPQLQAQTGFVARVHDPSQTLPRDDASWRN
jgi:RES domain-containing protein